MSFTYKGLKAVLERHIVTDTEVDRQIQRLQQQYPRVASVTDRATRMAGVGRGRGSTRGDRSREVRSQGPCRLGKGLDFCSE